MHAAAVSFGYLYVRDALDLEHGRQGRVRVGAGAAPALAAAAALAATAHGAALRNGLMITVDGETRPASSPHPTCR